MAHSLARAHGAAAFFQFSLRFSSSLQSRSGRPPLQAFHRSYGVPAISSHRPFEVLTPAEARHTSSVDSTPVKEKRQSARSSTRSFAEKRTSVESIGSSTTLTGGGAAQRNQESSSATLGMEADSRRQSSEKGIPNEDHGFPRSHSIEGVTSGYNSTSEEGPTLVVIGGGAAGIFGAIRAKELCPGLEVVVLEKSAPLSKVRISGGGRCNVTTGLHVDPGPLSGQYPRGHRELRGAFFRSHGPKDTADWFESRGVALKKEDDGRMFPVTDTSSTVIDCLLSEVQRLGVKLRNGANVLSVRKAPDGLFEVTLGPVTRPTTMTSAFLLLATGSAQRGYELATALGHSIVDPRPSLFTFCTPDKDLTALAGISFAQVGGQLHLEGQSRKAPLGLRQEGPLLLTHWGLSGPLVLKLSAWGARDLFDTAYKGSLIVDFLPAIAATRVHDELLAHKARSGKKQLSSGAPPAFDLPRRFWLYLLQREKVDPEATWAHVQSKPLQRLGESLKRCTFSIAGKGQFKDEFVKAGGVPLKEVTLSTMESRACPGLFLAGELLDVDGVTGGFNFQNAWTGGYIAGSTLASRANELAEADIEAAVECCA